MGKLLSILFIVGFLFLFSPSATAATPISQLVVTTSLQKNGSVEITQQITLPTPDSLEWRVFSNIRDLTIQADGETVPESKISTSKKSGVQTIKVIPLAKNWEISYTTTTSLIRTNNRDQIFIKIFQDIPSPIYNLKATFTLPTVSSDTQLNGNAFAISGVTNPRAVTRGNTVEYLADFAAQGSLFTISASWPKTVLPLSLGEEVRLYLSNLEVLPWLILGILLPLVSLTILLVLYRRRKETEISIATVSNQQPSQLSALMVGILVQKKIYPQVIVALLVELCKKGYIVIVNRAGEYYLSQRKPIDEHLEIWEKDILEELFPARDHLETQGLQEVTEDSLFSPKVRDAFERMYQVITDQKFFAENPHYTRVKFKLFALLLYFISAIGLLWVAAAGLSPYLSIPLGGTMLVSFLIIRLTPKLVRYSQIGLKTRNDWMAFGNYLALDQPLPLESTQNRTFEAYLPYAIALHKTKEWAKRFDKSSTTIIKPDWFITYKESTTTQFVDDITAFTETISESITHLRGPLVS